MSETSQVPGCERCGAALSGHGQDRLCAACLLESAIVEPQFAGNVPGSAPTLLAFNDYELLEEIARGGMGVVYRGRQVSLNRPVAIKMILGGHLANAAEMQRFRAEAETAAQLQHPNIVAIHEVGEYAGQPFFSMDLVAGRNLAQLVRDEPLPSHKAASYLKTIAEAVHYAHSRGVLHRDLKPSNVLIDENDQPRVTDFGLAKRFSNPEAGTRNSELTQTGQVLGSPSFIPPEQAAGQRNTISPASDVYSLGAILYHLLTGRPPFLADSVPATLRMAAETEPVAPRLLNPTIPRDLETVCLKCLEKDPLRRYGSARELAEELDRFLRDEPIQARPASSVERAQRWIRRKPALASAMALVLVVAIGSPIAALRINHERRQAEVNAKKAQLESEKSKQVAKFLREILGSAGPSVARGRDAALFREILEATSERVGKEIAGQPEVQGDIYATIGSAFRDIGDYRRAITNLELAVKSYRMAQVGDQPNLASALNVLGFCQSFTEDVVNGNKNARLGLEMARRCNDKEMLFICLMNYASSFLSWGMTSSEAEPFLKEALELKKQKGNDPAGLAVAMLGYSGFLTNAEENELMLQQALELLRKHLSPEHPKTIQAFFSLGQHLVNSGKFPEAEQALREARLGFQKIHDPSQPYQPIVLRFLAESLLAQGKGQEAESLVRQQLAATPTDARYLDLLGRVTAFRREWSADNEIIQSLKGDFLLVELPELFANSEDQAQVERLFRERLQKQREQYGPDNLKLAGPISRLAELYVKQRKFTDAESLYYEALAIEKKQLGEVHLDVANSLHKLAHCLQNQNKVADAEKLFREELAIRRNLQGDLHLDTAEALRGVAWMLIRQGNLPAAESAVSEALAIRKKLLGPKDQGVAEVLSNLADIINDQGRHSEAETLYREALALRGECHEAIWILEHLPTALRPQGKLDELESLYLRALALRRKFQPDGDPESIETLEYLSSIRRDQGKLAEAETFSREALGLRRKFHGNEHSDSVWPVYHLAALLRDQNKHSEAETSYLEALALMQKVFGAQDRSIPVTLNTLANMLSKNGRLAEAEKLHREAAEVARKLPPGKDRDELLSWSLGDLSTVLVKQGKPDHVDVPARVRTDSFARRGQWKETIASLRQSIESDADDSMNYLLLAPILLFRGEITEYRQLCGQMLVRFGETADPAVADRVAKACLINPNADADSSLAVKLADTAVTQGQSHSLVRWFELCKAMAEYRQGHFAEAADWAQKPLARPGDPFERDACAYLVLAMAQTQLKQDSAACVALGKATEILKGKIPKLDGDDLGAFWVDVVIADLLMREAKGLIEGGAIGSSKAGK